MISVLIDIKKNIYIHNLAHNTFFCEYFLNLAVFKYWWEHFAVFQPEKVDFCHEKHMAYNYINVLNLSYDTKTSKTAETVSYSNLLTKRNKNRGDNVS